MMRLRSCIIYRISKLLVTPSLKNSAFGLDAKAWKGGAKFMIYFFLLICALSINFFSKLSR